MPPNDQRIPNDNTSVLQNAVRQLSAISLALSTAFPQVAGTATTATAGAATLPATPAGFLSVTLPDGTLAKIAYYND